MTRRPVRLRPKTTSAPAADDNTTPVEVNHPAFAQPQPTDDPTKFEIKHPSDNPAYKQIDELNREHKLAPMPFPAPRGGVEPQLALAAILGPDGKAAVDKITQAGQMVFHAVGDTGNTRGPEPQNQVSDKMVNDFGDTDEKERPQFLFHLGDVVYSFGEAKYYYDQFFDPYRNYPAPIVAIAGNHDGMVAPETNTTTLAAFLENFCAPDFEATPEAGGLARTAQIQPGVFFTFEAPFVRILALYSNVLEDPGVIADAHIGDSQLKYLEAALKRVKSEHFTGALIIAHHHPAFTAGGKHGWSTALTAQIDKICTGAGVWPHAVLSGHAHNYQRFTRVHGQMQIPYIIGGNGGHGLVRLSRKNNTLRAPQVIQAAGKNIDQIVLENYDDLDYGYLRVIVTDTRLRVEYHLASDGDAAKAPDDFVSVDLTSRRLVHFSG